MNTKKRAYKKQAAREDRETKLSKKFLELKLLITDVSKSDKDVLSSVVGFLLEKSTDNQKKEIATILGQCRPTLLLAFYLFFETLNK